MDKKYDILVYVHEPSGYGDWTGPEGFTCELPLEIEKYIVNDDVQKGKQLYVRTDYVVRAHDGKDARLYVPKGTTAQDSGLEIFEIGTLSI